MSLRQHTTTKEALCMDRITQEAYNRQRMLKYKEKHGVIETAIRYQVSRKTVWKWSSRYDGTLESLKERSRRPKHSPQRQSEEERKLVKRLYAKYGNDLILAYQLAIEKGYKRSYGCFKRTALAQQEKPKPKPKKKPKPYERAAYPGQKVQLDVKFVPQYCCSDGKKYYQYTAKDECSRWTYRQLYDEHSTYSSFAFLKKLIAAAPFPIRKIQTDNGTEFTNMLISTKCEHNTLFENALEEYGIEYQRIRIGTPQHNGKVERQHRLDEMRFYKHMRMFSLDDGRKQLACYQRFSNNIIMTCLNMKSPNQVLEMYHGIM